MPHRRTFTSFAVALAAAVVTMGLYAGTAAASGQVSWVGQGSDSVTACSPGETPYLHWIFTTGGARGNTVSAAMLTVNGSSTSMSPHGLSWTANTDYYDLSKLSAYVDYTGQLGHGHANLVISDGCYGPTTPPTPIVSLGYADNYYTHGNPSGLPWSYLSTPPTYLIGCGVDPNGGGTTTDNCPQLPSGYGTGDEYDGGAILIENPSTTSSMSVTSGLVTIGSCTYSPWSGLNISIPAGGSLVLTQTGGPNPCPSGGKINGDFNFDTSEAIPGLNGSNATNCTNDGLVPVVSLTIDGTAMTIYDNGQILNDGGVDLGSGACNKQNEFHAFVQVSP